MVWYREDTPIEQERQDFAEAQRDAIIAATVPPPVSYVVVTDNSREAAADALGAAIGDAIVTAMKEAAIINSEMQAKGYRLVTPQQAATLATDNAVPAAYTPSSSGNDAIPPPPQ